MRGIRIKLSVFEFDTLKAILLDRLKLVKDDEIVKQAIANILNQFQRKIDRANQRRTIRKGGICVEHYN